MKDINTSGVFRLIRRAGPITRRQIEAAIDLSWGAISGTTAKLLREGYIKEVKGTATTGAGRPSVALEVNREGRVVLGLDVNRSGLAGVVTNLAGEVLLRIEHEPTATHRDEWIEAVCAMIEELSALTNGREILAIGIAMQGAVDAARGVAASFPAKDWQNVPLAAILSERFALPVYLEHDPDCILYAASAERDLQDAILLRADKGIGMAVMLNTKIFKRFGAFEIGEMPIGKERLMDVATLTGACARGNAPFHEIAEAAKHGEPNATAIFTQMGEALGIAIDTLAQIFNLRDFLLCGKLMRYRALLEPSLRATIAKYPTHTPLQVDYTEVELAAVGAALLAIERHELHLD